MEVGILLWWSLDVHLRIGLTRYFVSDSGEEFYSCWWDKLIICNYIYSYIHSFVANGLGNYCIELWFTLGVFLMKLLWKFLMLVLDMNYLDWIVKKEKINNFGMYFSCFGPLGSRHDNASTITLYTTCHVVSCEWWRCGFITFYLLLTTRHMASYGNKMCKRLWSSIVFI